MENVVSLHPYFTAHEGKLDEIKALLPSFVEKTATEEACYYYNFTIHGNELHCREGYNGAAGALAHIANVGEQIGKLLEISDLTRFEIHGPAEELEKLKEPMADLNPIWFEFVVGI